MSFIFYNPNPSGKRTGDCVIRAIAKATGQDWERAYTNLCVEGYTLYDLPSSRMNNGRNSGYSRHDGKEDMIANLHDMLNDATSAKEKDAIHQCIEKLQNM